MKPLDYACFGHFKPMQTIACRSMPSDSSRNNIQSSLATQHIINQPPPSLKAPTGQLPTMMLQGEDTQLIQSFASSLLYLTKSHSLETRSPFPAESMDYQQHRTTPRTNSCWFPCTTVFLAKVLWKLPAPL